MPKNGARHQLEAMAEAETAGNTLPMAQAEADAGRATAGGVEMNFPFVLENIRTGRVGVAIRMHKTKPDTYQVTLFKDGRTYGSTNWRVNSCKKLEVAPSDVGYSPPPKPMPKYPVRHKLTRSVAMVCREYVRDGKLKYRVCCGGVSVYWNAENVEKITETEYQSGLKNTPVKIGRGGSRKHPKKEIKNPRYCRTCKKLIKNGNWWYCAECHQEMIREDNRMGVDESWMNGDGHSFTPDAKRSFTGSNWGPI